MAFSSTWSVSVVLLLCLLVASRLADDLRVQALPESDTDTSATSTEISDPVVYSVNSNDSTDTTSFASVRTSTEDFDPNADGASFSESTNAVDYTYDATVTNEKTTEDTFASSNVEGGSGSDVPEGFDMNEFVADDSINTTTTDMSASLASQSSGCGTGNPIDECWKCDSNWASHRQRLADCAIGFGRNAIGGKNGRIYVVTSSRDDDPANPSPGTLRYAVTRPEALWIIFARSMTIRLRNELIITSFKTIDGRGVNVQIAGGAGLTIQYVTNVIVEGIAIHDIQATGPARIMSSTFHVGNRGVAPGNAISIFTSKNIWVDHCYLARAADGLINAIHGSSMITISNNYFTQHDEVMLFGAHKEDTVDRNMRITVAYNTFGPGLNQRLPRIRFGTVHVVNNDYSAGWGIYAIGGSEDPTILSQGNIFNPGHGPKQVTKRINDGGSSYGGPQNWNWRSVGDIFWSGAYFTGSGSQTSAQAYAKAYSCSARPASMVVKMTSRSGPSYCRPGSSC